jgi:hypothetical protein
MSSRGLVVDGHHRRRAVGDDRHRHPAREAAAMMLGPAGLGLLGLYNALLQTSSSLAGLGLGSSGVRQIAASGADAAELSRVRRVLLAGNLLQGLAAWRALGAARAAGASGPRRCRPRDRGRPDRRGAGPDPARGSQTALLQGMRRIGDLARVSVIERHRRLGRGLGPSGFSAWTG